LRYRNSLLCRALERPTINGLDDGRAHQRPDDAHVPFGGVRHSGNSSRFGTAAANIEAYTDTRWITVQPTPPAYRF